MGGGLLALAILLVKSMKANQPKGTPQEYNQETGATVNNNVRAVRNLNPGNVRYTGEAWQGLTGQDDKGFCQFGSVDMGARCMVKLLRNYAKLHGKDTVRDVITRYAPSVENDTKSYINVVSHRMGVPADQKLNLVTDAENLTSLAYNMHIHEAGFAWVDAEIFRKYAKEFTK